ncbi:MAG: DUF1285 domain-containing protein [Paracoccaceae bacterium]
MGVKPTADGLAARAGAAASGKGPPPVHLWNPPFCGDIDMRIARDGTWHYLGSPIGRPALVRLFSSILRREGDEFFLVTPAEKLRIRVDDAPFVAVDFTVTGAGRAQAITFTTHVGDTATAGADHPIRVRFARDGDEPSPYVLIRAGLDALIDRKSFYRLIDHAVHDEHRGERWFGLWSGGQFFPVMRSGELE